jgi:hypothetical protein
MIGSRSRFVQLFRLLPLGLVFVCLPLQAQRDVSPGEARQIGEDRQKDARKQAKRAQRQAKHRQEEIAREIKRRDRERRSEAKQLTKARKKQGEQVEARAGQPEKPAEPPKADGPNRDQPSPIERLRGYSGADPKQ